VSLLGSVSNVFKGAVGGFASGGIGGLVSGALAGSAKQNIATGQGKGRQLMQTQYTSQYSASPSARLSPITRQLGGGQIQMQMPGVSYSPGGSAAAGTYTPSGKMRYSHNVIDPVTGRVYRVSDKTNKIIKPRHMNPMNGRAAARAIRRVKAARKMLMAIERSLPKARTHRARP
jgi:hypothetical protein